MIAALVVLALLVWWFVSRRGAPGASAPEDTNTAKPSVSAWNETSSPTPRSATPSDPRPSGGALVSCPTAGGNALSVSGARLQGGGLHANTISGWGDGANQFTMRWAHDTESQTSTVQSNGLATWFSVVSLSSLLRSDGFTSVGQAAVGVMGCFASSSYYQGFTDSKPMISQAVTIDGHRGYRARDEVHVNDSNFPGIAGDVVDVLVVDTGDPGTFGLFVSSYTIGDTQRQPLVDATIASIGVG